MKNIYVHLSDMLKKKEPLVLATIIETKGSSPQVPGASAIFSTEGLRAGTLGGGPLEFSAQKRAVQIIKKGDSLFFGFDLKGDISSWEDPICGGEVRILMDASPEKSEKAFHNLNQSFAQRKLATPQEFDRIHAPMGIEIQSKTVEEIAISIAAQLILIRNQTQKSMKERR